MGIALEGCILFLGFFWSIVVVGRRRCVLSYCWCCLRFLQSDFCRGSVCGSLFWRCLQCLIVFRFYSVMGGPAGRSRADRRQILPPAWHIEQRHLKATIAKQFPTRDVRWTYAPTQMYSYCFVYPLPFYYTWIIDRREKWSSGFCSLNLWADFGVC